MFILHVTQCSYFARTNDKDWVAQGSDYELSNGKSLFLSFDSCKGLRSDAEIRGYRILRNNEFDIGKCAY
jgi:hypothetical protein